MGTENQNFALAVKWQDYHERRNKWVAHNFPTTEDLALPMEETCEGIVEELGELAHANLKSKQNIRGSQVEHEAAAKDAVGDIVVYLWGITGRQPATFIGKDFWSAVDYELTKPRVSYILEMAAAVGCIAGNISQSYSASGYTASRYHCTRLVALLIGYCRERGWDFNQVVDETWKVVEKRDWQLYPDTGLPPKPFNDTDLVG
jgi:hypothetical protein